MSSFNNVNKVIYKENQDQIVSLLEYILFENTKDSEKYLVFKFNNNLNQSLKEIKFEISEYNEDNELIEKAILEYDKFEAKPGTSFVPNAKLKVNFDCKTIKAKLLYAAFERVAWNNGEYEQLKYTKDEFRNDFKDEEKKLSLRAQKVADKKEAKLLKMAYKKEIKLEKKLDSKRHFVSKEFINSNLTKTPRVVTILLLISFVIYLGVSIFYFNKENLRFYEDGFQYEVSTDGATIIDYDGGLTDVIIPAKAMDYDVIAVGEKAFKDDNLSSLTLTSKIKILDMAFKDCYSLYEIKGGENITRIGDYAFENCKSLSNLELASATYIGKGAFKGCLKLYNVLSPSARISEEAFSGCNSLDSLVIKETTENLKAKDMFGEEIPYSLRNLSTSSRKFISGYFDDMKNVKVIMENEDEAEFEYGALNGLNHYNDSYEINDSYEMYKGKMIAVNPNTDYFHLKSNVPNLKENLKSLDLSKIKTLRIDPQSEIITNEIIKSFSNIEKLEYVDGTDFYEDAFRNSRINTLILDSNSSYYNGIDVKLNGVTNLIIKGSSPIRPELFTNPKSSFDFSSITNLKVESSSLYKDTFKGLANLKSIELPNPNISINGLGINKEIEEIVLTNSSNKRIVDNFLQGYYRLNKLTLPTNISYIGSGFLDSTSLYSLELPASVKQIESRFIHNCQNLTRLALPEGLLSIGDDFINGSSLTSLSLPKTLTKLGRNIIEASKISSLIIPEGVKTIGSPILKKNSGISSITTPIISGSYQDFNEDYLNTYSLTVTGDIRISSTSLSNIPNLTRLYLKGNTSGIKAGVLKGTNNLSDLEIHGDMSCKLKDLFAADKVSIERIIISTDKFISRFFEDCSIKRLAISKANVLDVNMFTGFNGAEAIYIPSDVQKDGIDYSYLASKAYYFYTNNQFDEEVKKILKSKNKTIIENYSLEDFIGY